MNSDGPASHGCLARLCENGGAYLAEEMLRSGHDLRRGAFKWPAHRPSSQEFVGTLCLFIAGCVSSMLACESHCCSAGLLLDERVGSSPLVSPEALTHTHPGTDYALVMIASLTYAVLCGRSMESSHPPTESTHRVAGSGRYDACDIAFSAPPPQPPLHPHCSSRDPAYIQRRYTSVFRWRDRLFVCYGMYSPIYIGRIQASIPVRG